MSEAAVERNPRGNSPAAQNSVIPLNWKPSKAEPVPVVRCTQVKKDGERCNRWSMRGTTKCYHHGGRGNFQNVEKYREAVIESARLRLVDMTEEAAEQLAFLMQPGTADQIRLKAATEVLDRAGIKGGFDIQLEGDVTINTAETVHERLAKLAEGASAMKRMRDEQEAERDIVDGEVISDTSDQPTLFELDDDEADDDRV